MFPQPLKCSPGDPAVWPPWVPFPRAPRGTVCVQDSHTHVRGPQTETFAGPLHIALPSPAPSHTRVGRASPRQVHITVSL